MTVTLNRKQKRTLREALAEADRFGASPVERKALTEALGTEANYLNPKGGDGTSAGPLQEINSYGSVTRRRNTTLASRRFLTEARALRRKGFKGRAGKLAQAVQRSAYPERYEQHSGEADAILSQLGGGRSLAQSMRPAASASAFDPGAPSQVQLEQRAQNPIQSAGLTPPSFSAQPTLPQGFQQPPSSGPPAPLPTPDVPAPDGQAVDLSAQQAPAASGGSLGRTSGSTRGKLRVDPGADRPGVQTKPEVVDFLERVAGRSGHPIRLGTGTRHSKNTVTGNVSDHWEGRAGDVPATGHRLVALGQAALIEAGWSPRRAHKAKGGLYNVTKNGKRIQIIFNINTPETGDHTNHLHVGFSE